MIHPCLRRVPLFVFLGSMLGFLILSGCASQQALDSGGGKSKTNAQPRVVSPEIGTNGLVTFRLKAPKARSVVLTGEFMKGTNDFTKGKAGLWSTTIGPIKPEIYSYNFIIDGVRTIDPNNPNVKTGST